MVTITALSKNEMLVKLYQAMQWKVWEVVECYGAMEYTHRFLLNKHNNLMWHWDVLEWKPQSKREISTPRLVDYEELFQDSQLEHGSNITTDIQRAMGLTVDGNSFVLKSSGESIYKIPLFKVELSNSLTVAKTTNWSNIPYTICEIAYNNLIYKNSSIDYTYQEYHLRNDYNKSRQEGITIHELFVKVTDFIEGYTKS